jgi:hypothetical protein
MHEWWTTVPAWAKPVILGAFITALIGFLAWLITVGLPTVRRRVYLHILRKLRDSQTALEVTHQIFDRPTPDPRYAGYVPPEEIIKHSGWPRFLVKWAIHWQERKHLENSEPPFKL